MSAFYGHFPGFTGGSHLVHQARPEHAFASEHPGRWRPDAEYNHAVGGLTGPIRAKRLNLAGPAAFPFADCAEGDICSVTMSG